MYEIFIDENLDLDINTVNSILSQNFNIEFNNYSDSVDSDIIVQFSEKFLKESYELSINENKIQIKASDKAGALYGIQSLKQLMLSSKLDNTNLKHVFINDSLDFHTGGCY
ncbi:MAG: hypothetical protein CM15mP126_7410 [Gammaproteobacteria bacterium]|nr:MAG: hypothetical protein CM15mP126_7410 [Gammaproteobacteria bacterium]